MHKDRLIFKLITGLFLVFYSVIGLTDLNKQVLNLSMDNSTHAAFIKSLQESLNFHPESLLQDSLIAQQINQHLHDKKPRKL